MPLDRARAGGGETDAGQMRALPMHPAGDGQSQTQDTGRCSDLNGGTLFSSMLYCWQHRRKKPAQRSQGGVKDLTRDRKREDRGPGEGVRRTPPPQVHTGQQSARKP